MLDFLKNWLWEHSREEQDLLRCLALFPGEQQELAGRAYDELTRDTPCPSQQIYELIAMGMLQLNENGQFFVSGFSVEQTKDLFCRGYCPADAYLWSEVPINVGDTISLTRIVMAGRMSLKLHQASSICEACAYHSGSQYLPCAVHPDGPENNECPDFEEK